LDRSVQECLYDVLLTFEWQYNECCALQYSDVDSRCVYNFIMGDVQFADVRFSALDDEVSNAMQHAGIDKPTHFPTHRTG